MAIASRELRSAFGRPATFGVLALFVGLFSLLTLWFDDWLVAGSATLRQPLWWLWVCLLLVIPAVTMRTLVEEHKSGTWSIVGTLPLGPSEVVLGKWLGVMGFVAVALLLTLPWPIALAWLGDPEPGPLLGGYLGVVLPSGALCAVGLAASASTESAVVAFLVPFVAGAVPWLVGRALPLVPLELVWLVEPLSFDHHFDDLARGVLDLRSVAVFLALTAVPLRLAVHLLERRRLC
jgi:ABC-2 type transport system permease protein